jgi:hypothetical protein
MTSMAVIAAASAVSAGAATYGAMEAGKQSSFAKKEAKKAENKLNQAEAANQAKIEGRNKRYAGMNTNLMSGDVNGSSGYTQ